MWWDISLIPAPGRQKQVGLFEFEANLVYIEFQASQTLSNNNKK